MRPTLKAAKDCSNWLRACSDLGWRKEDMGRLADLWWEFHDDEGNLYPPGQTRPVVNGGSEHG